jgi:hypothetical protein
MLNASSLILAHPQMDSTNVELVAFHVQLVHLTAICAKSSMSMLCDS